MRPLSTLPEKDDISIGSLKEDDHQLNSTRRAIGYLRPVTSDICIILNESSIVTPFPLEFGRIPSHKFKITKLGDIYSIVKNLALDQDSL